MDAGLPPVLPRGPRPVGPLDLGGLMGRILAMHHRGSVLCARITPTREMVVSVAKAFKS